MVRHARRRIPVDLNGVRSRPPSPGIQASGSTGKLGRGLSRTVGPPVLQDNDARDLTVSGLLRMPANRQPLETTWSFTCLVHFAKRSRRPIAASAVVLASGSSNDRTPTIAADSATNRAPLNPRPLGRQFAPLVGAVHVAGRAAHGRHGVRLLPFGRMALRWFARPFPSRNITLDR